MNRVVIPIILMEAKDTTMPILRQEHWPDVIRIKMVWMFRFSLFW